jgi:hypothetical protein
MFENSSDFQKAIEDCSDFCKNIQILKIVQIFKKKIMFEN